MDRPSIHVFFHLAAMGEFYREVACEIAGAIEGAGLYDAANSLTCVTVGDASTRYLFYPRWRTEIGGKIYRWEYPTLVRLWQTAQMDPESYCLYVHTKGVSYVDGRRFRTQWRRIMTHQVVTRWRHCVEQLAEHEMVGPFWVGAIGNGGHYGGNFWWARSSYIATLPRPSPNPTQKHPRLNAEIWPTSQLRSGYNLHPMPWVDGMTPTYIRETYREGEHGAPITA